MNKQEKKKLGFIGDSQKKRKGKENLCIIQEESFLNIQEQTKFD